MLQYLTLNLFFFFRPLRSLGRAQWPEKKTKIIRWEISKNIIIGCVVFFVVDIVCQCRYLFLLKKWSPCKPKKTSYLLKNVRKPYLDIIKVVYKRSLLFRK